MLFSDVMAQVDAGHYEVPAGWTQGRACFGGLVAAIMYRRLQTLVPGRLPRSLFVSFVGPGASGRIDIEESVLRTGGSVTQAGRRILHEGRVVAVMWGNFGMRRDSRRTVIGGA